MFNIIDSRSNRVVAQAIDFEQAKLLANIYRKEHYIKDWKVVLIKKQRPAPLKTFFVSEGCCDGLRDRNCELFGRPH